MWITTKITKSMAILESRMVKKCVHTIYFTKQNPFQPFCIYLVVSDLPILDTLYGFQILKQHSVKTTGFMKKLLITKSLENMTVVT